MTNYSFLRWTDEMGAVIGTAPSLSIVIDRDRTLQAEYQEVVPPTATLDITAGTGGTTSPAPGSYTYNTGVWVQVTALPDSGYVFDHFELDGASRSTNPLSMLIDANHALKAVFSTVTPPPPTKYNLTIATTLGGTTDPAPGVHEYDAGTSASVAAAPSSGYAFDHWELDGKSVNGNPTSVLMDREHSILAVFRTSAGPISNTVKAIAVVAGLTTLVAIAAVALKR